MCRSRRTSWSTSLLPLQGPGREGLGQGPGLSHGALPHLHRAVQEQVAEGEKAVTRFTWTGTHRGESLGIGADGTVGGGVAGRHRRGPGRPARGSPPHQGHSRGVPRRPPSRRVRGRASSPLASTITPHEAGLSCRVAESSTSTPPRSEPWRRGRDDRVRPVAIGPPRAPILPARPALPPVPYGDGPRTPGSGEFPASCVRGDADRPGGPIAARSDHSTARDPSLTWDGIGPRGTMASPTRAARPGGRRTDGLRPPRLLLPLGARRRPGPPGLPGPGPAAQLAALLVEERRSGRRERARAWRAEEARGGGRRPASGRRTSWAIAMRAALLAAGYHQHDRGAWRRRRMHGDDATDGGNRGDPLRGRWGSPRLGRGAIPRRRDPAG